MKRPTNLIIFIILFGSCSYNTVPKHIKKGFTFRVDEMHIPSSPKLRTDGYYSNYHPFKRSIYSNPFDRDKITYELDTTQTYRVFFTDGTFLTGNYSSDDQLNQQFVRVSKNDSQENTEAFYTYQDWGLYKISGDTIKVQHINRPGLGESSLFWYAYEESFIILDEVTIQQIDVKPIHKMTADSWKVWEINKRENKDGNIIDLRPSKYVQSKNLPSPNNWIRQQDWTVSNGGK